MNKGKLILSYRPGSKIGEERLRVTRATIRAVNTHHLGRGFFPKRFSLRQKAVGPSRLYAWKYRNKHKMRLRMEDATRIDVFLVFRD